MSQSRKTTRSQITSDSKGKAPKIEPKDDDLWSLLLSNYSSPSSESQISTTQSPKTPLAQYLEDFTRNLIAICNSRDWSNPLFTLSLAPNVKFSFHSLHTGKDQNSQGIHGARLMMQRLLDRPEVRISPISVVAEVHPPSVAANGKKVKRNGTESSYATVWCVLQVGGVPEGILRETSAVFHYKRERDGRWLMAGCKSFTNRPPLWDGLDGPYDRNRGG